MIMNKICKIFVFAAAVLLAGCVQKYDCLYSGDPGLDASKIIFDKKIEPFFAGAYLLRFYKEYEPVRDDRDKALRLAEEYFGDQMFTDSDITYDQIRIMMLGKLVAGNGGAFSFTDRFNIQYTVTQISDMVYRFTSPNGVLSAVMDISGEIYMNELDASYVDNMDSDQPIDVKVTAFEEYPMHLDRFECSSAGLDGGYASAYYFGRYNGRLSYDIRGNDISDAFVIVYDNGSVQLSREGF